MSKVKKKMKVALKKKVENNPLHIDEQQIRKLTRLMLKRKQEGHYDKEASIMYYSEADVRDIISREWKLDITNYKDNKEKFESTLKILEKSRLGTSKKAQGQNNFLNGLRNRGVLDQIEEELGEKIDPSKLKMTGEATYVYDDKLNITYQGKNGYQEVPTWELK